MASLALGVVGAFVGSFFGPLGTSIGFALGSALGNALFPEHQQGPRLTDRRIQTSTYGVMLPFCWGTVRLAGNVIDQSPEYDEHSHEEGGKGGPVVETFSYSASLDIEICQPTRFGVGIVGIQKIWMDGRVMFDSSPGGDTSAVKFTFYDGGETQLPDPTFEAIHGIGNVPAYRGTCHIVFTDLDVTQFGNRLPFIEVLVITKGHTNAALHITKLQASDESPPIVWGGGTIHTGTDPAILDWESSGGIRIKGRGTVDVEDYDEDLAHTGSELAEGPLDFVPDNIDLLQLAHLHLTWHYYAIGLYLIDQVPVQCWVAPTNPITIAPQFPTLAATDIFLNGDENPESSNSFAEAAGIPIGEYVGATVLTRDGSALFVFTAPSNAMAGGDVIDKWYKLVNAVVVDHGTVSPGLSQSELGFSSYSSFSYGSAQFEDNARWMWRFYGAGEPGGIVKTYHIDDAKNFAFNSVGGTLLPPADPTNQIFNVTSGRVLEEGYFGIVYASTLAIVSRFPVDESLEVPLSEIVGDISVMCGLNESQFDVTDLTPTIPGFMIASQMTGRAAIEPLQPVAPFDAVESDKIKFVRRGKDSIITIPDEHLAAYADTGNAPKTLELVRTQEEELPAKVYVKYLNPDADFQQNTQLAQRMVTRSVQVVTLEAAIVISDERAMQMAQVTLYEAWNTRNRRKFYTSRRYSAYEPTDVVTIQGIDLRIEDKSEGVDGVITFQAVPSRGHVLTQGSASGGAAGFTPQTVAPAQASQVYLLDIPMVTDDDTGGPYVAMAGATSERWRGAALFRSSDGVSYTQVARSTTADVIGVATNVLADFTGGNTFDEASTLHVVIGPGGGTLASYTESDVAGGIAGMLLVGNEIVQAKNAVLTAPGEYDLSGFLRGRRGTEWAIGTHGGSETVIKLPTSINLPVDSANLNILKYYKAITVGQNSGAARQFTNTGNAIRPYSPTHLGGGFEVSGDGTLTWQRRTRIGGQWRSYNDVPLSEASEGYFVEIWDSDYTTLKRTISGLTTQTATYTVADQTTDFGAPQTAVYFKVFQQGTFLPSRGTRGRIPNPVITWTSDLEPVPGVIPVPPSGGGGAATIPLTWSTPGTLQAYSRDYGGFAPDGAISISFTTPAGTSAVTGRLSAVEFQDPPTPRTCCLSTVNGDFNIGIPGYSASKIADQIPPRVFFTVGTPAPEGAVRLESSTTYYWNMRNGVTNAESCNIQVTLQKPAGL